MVDLEKPKSEFWDGQYEDKNDTLKGKPAQFDKEGIKIAIKRALGDFTDWMERLKPEYKDQSFSVEQKYKVLCGTDMEEDSEPKDGSFVQNFIDYFFKNPVEFKSQKDFDGWHKKNVRRISKYNRTEISGRSQIRHGAENCQYDFQKRLLSAHNGIKEDKFKKYFEHCHMPLDSITLEWVKRTQAWLCSKSAESSGCKRKKQKHFAAQKYQAGAIWKT